MQGKDLTPQQITKFLKKLSATHGNVSKACQAAVISRAAVYERKKNDESFSQAWDDVIEKSVELAEQELYRRSVQGYNKPIFYKGVLVKTIKEFSDRLLEFYLKSKRPEVYRERVDVNQNLSGNLSLDITLAIDSVYGEKKEEKENVGETNTE